MAKGKRKIWVTDEQYAILFPETDTETQNDEESKEESEMKATKKMPLWAKILIGVAGAGAIGGGAYAAISHLGKKDDFMDAPVDELDDEAFDYGSDVSEMQDLTDKVAADTDK